MKIEFPVINRNPTIISGPFVIIYGLVTLVTMLILILTFGEPALKLIVNTFTPLQFFGGLFIIMTVIAFAVGYIKVVK